MSNEAGGRTGWQAEGRIRGVAGRQTGSAMAVKQRFQNQEVADLARQHGAGVKKSRAGDRNSEAEGKSGYQGAQENTTREISHYEKIST